MEHGDGHSHPRATEPGDGDAGDNVNSDAFKCADVNASTRSANEYASANTANADSGLYGGPRLEWQRMCLSAG